MSTAPVTVGRPPPWRDVRVLRIVFQIGVVGAVAGLVLFLSGNLQANLEAQGIPTSYDYLREPAGFTILGSEFRPSQSFRQALLVGIANTALVAFVGIALATLLGIFVGVARLSTNWLVRRLAGFYVESIRNVPVLVVIVFTYFAIALRLPPIEEAADLGLFQISNRGIWTPWLEAGSGAGGFWAFVLVGAFAAVAVGWSRTRRWNATGQPHHRVLWGGAVLLSFALVAHFVLGGPLSVSLPERTGRDVAGGIRLLPEYAALLFALVVYTASHIAEIVRGSILAVQKGQTEAATALGLSSFQRLRYVILPQAFRVAIPPMGNQYLNLTKNSSLAVAIGFPEITRITSLMIQQVPAPQAIALLMAIYLAFSLFISAITNLVNRAFALKER
ncbi:MAG: amino acid ABC transporter permease [Actinomycetota bacterium]